MDIESYLQGYGYSDKERARFGGAGRKVLYGELSLNKAARQYRIKKPALKRYMLLRGWNAGLQDKE